jgi:hypothetical protein
VDHGPFDRHQCPPSEITYIDLIEIAREFGVPTEALVYLLRSLNHLDEKTGDHILGDPKFSDTDRGTMHDSWWKPPELPERFVRLAFIA